MAMHVYSQIDTLSSLDYLYSGAQNKQEEIKHSKHIIGCSVFGGLGLGGNDPNSGFAKGVSVRVHYNIHAINIYTSLATKSQELIYGTDYKNALNSNCSGIIYGIGSYGKHSSGSIGAGLGYCQTHVLKPQRNGLPPAFFDYREFGVCIGGQITFNTKFIGFTMQSYCNISHSIVNYTALVGLELMLNDIKRIKKTTIAFQ